MGVLTLVPLDPAACPDCGARLVVLVVEEPALIRHGGYGGTRRTTTRRCPRRACGWTLEAEVAEVWP